MSNIIIKIQEGAYSVSISYPKENEKSAHIASLAAIAAKDAADEVIARETYNSNHVQKKMSVSNISNIAEFKEMIHPEDSFVQQNRPSEDTAKQKDDLFQIRDRIPNNAVDLKDLKIGKAGTENALVRCPNCGQSHVLIVKCQGNYYLMGRDYNKGEFVQIGEVIENEDELNNIYYKSEVKGVNVSKEDYFVDIQNIIKRARHDDFNLVIDNQSVIICPVCQKSDNFLTWKEAFANPESFFEFNVICDACGGEVITKNIGKKSPKYRNQCESCGHIQSTDEGGI